MRHIGGNAKFRIFVESFKKIDSKRVFYSPIPCFVFRAGSRQIIVLEKIGIVRSRFVDEFMRIFPKIKQSVSFDAGCFLFGF